MADADAGADVQGRVYSNALQPVSIRGHETLVKILLNEGAVDLENSGIL